MTAGTSARPVVAALLSAVVPGLGQLYVGRWRRGVAILLTISFSALVVLWHGVPGWSLAPAVMWMWAVWDAWGVSVGFPRSAIAPVMVVLGNPPYSYESENTGEWISKLTRDYYQIDGKPLGERNPKGLQDDYVKFIRFAQWRIQQTGYGVLAFITNHGYLDNPTFRGMRKSLMNTFDDIYILNLHGNSKKKEKCPDGSKDENVFDIQQGVAIGIFVKSPVGAGLKPAPTIRHSDLWGLRDGKYKWLRENELSNTEWEPLKPQEPHYLFVPQDTGLLEEYDKGWKITDMMPVNSVGLYTARDGLAIQESKNALKGVIKDFVSLSPEEARQKYELGPDSSEWQIADAQQDIRASKLDENKILPVFYRPFDIRFTYFTGTSRGLICRPRPEVMSHMTHSDNMAICFIRRSREQSVSNFFSTRHLVDKTILSSADNANLAPLYLYPQTEIEKRTGASRCPNLAPAFIKDLAGRLGMEFIIDGKGNKTKTFHNQLSYSRRQHRRNR